MSEKNLVLLLTAHECYFKQCDSFKSLSEKTEDEQSIQKTDGFSAQEAAFFQSVTETYVPLLNMLGSLCADRVPFKLSMVITPTLCALLTDDYLKKRYVQYLTERAAFAEQEVARCAAVSSELKAQAEQCFLSAKKALSDYVDVYKTNLLSQFAEYEKQGVIELLATAATHAFLPHFADIPEAVNAQIEAGLVSHRHFFGSHPDGFYLPYLGYCDPLARILRSYNLSYTVVDSRAVLFSQKRPKYGIFAPVRTDGFLSVLAADNDVADMLHSMQSSPVYRNEEKDAGFELEREKLLPLVKGNAPRIQTGCKYYSENAIYNAESAQKQALADAEAFVLSREQKLTKAADILADELPNGYSTIDVCTIDTNHIGKLWHEGFFWLENVIRIAAKKNLFHANAKEIIEKQIKLQKLDLFPCAATGTGFGEDLLDSMNDKMLVYARKSTMRMIDLTERFPNDTGIKARLLNLAAREILLAQSGDFPRLVHDSSTLEFAEQSFQNTVEAFSTVYDSLGSNSVSTEWLTCVEKDHPIFPWMNYRIFSKKK